MQMNFRWNVTITRSSQFKKHDLLDGLRRHSTTLLRTMKEAIIGLSAVAARENERWLFRARPLTFNGRRKGQDPW